MFWNHTKALESLTARIDALGKDVVALQVAESARAAVAAEQAAESRALITSLRMERARAGIGKTNGESGDLEEVLNARRRR